MIDAELLEILVCPETKQPLHLADAALLAQVNRAAAEGTLRNRGGEPVGHPLEQALVRQDGRVLYPVRDDIPIMLLDEAVELDPFGPPAAPPPPTP
jgi:uncharacterized protein YbaR (Trm112 family)